MSEIIGVISLLLFERANAEIETVDLFTDIPQSVSRSAKEINKVEFEIVELDFVDFDNVEFDFVASV